MITKYLNLSVSHFLWEKQQPEITWCLEGTVAYKEVQIQVQITGTEKEAQEDKFQLL